MTIFKIPVTWEVYGIMQIQSHNIEKAILEAGAHHYPLPIVDGIVDGSFEINFDIIESLNPGTNISDSNNEIEKRARAIAKGIKLMLESRPFGCDVVPADEYDN